MKKILFYNDTVRMGGHEYLALEAIKHLSTNYEIYVIISSSNLKFVELLTNVNSVKLFTIKYSTNKYQIFRNFTSFKTTNILKQLLNQIHPDLIVLVQGTIDSSVLCHFANKKIGCKIVSYLPFAHDLSNVSRKRLSGKVKDFVYRYYYRIPAGYITLNNAIKEQILRKSGNSNICVAHNGININNYELLNNSDVRSKFSIPSDKFVVGIIGRIEYWHKGLDYLVEFLKEYRYKYEDVVFMIVGDGNDKERLRKECSTFDNVVICDWVDNVSEVYSIIDCLLLLSRFEGVPLTILEATHFNLPIVSPRLDGLSDFVPDEYLFDIGNLKQIDTILDSIIKGNIILKDNLLNISLENFNNEFGNAIEYFIDR